MKNNRRDTAVAISSQNRKLGRLWNFANARDRTINHVREQMASLAFRRLFAPIQN